MNQKASMKNAGANNTWETVMRVVYPVKDAEQLSRCMRLIGLVRMLRRPRWTPVLTCAVWNSAP